MANSHPQTNGNGALKDPNGLLPGITVPEKVDIPTGIQDTEEPESFPGPDVNGRTTIVTKFTPAQLAKSRLVRSLYNTINAAFNEGHKSSGHLLVDRARLRSDNQLFDELGNSPGTLTYVIYYKDTEQVIGTASCKRYLGRVHIVEKDLTLEEKWGNTWKRFGLIPKGTAAWELSTMAVDPTLQRQGVAKYLMTIVEDEVKRMFRLLIQGPDGEEKPSRLLVMITTIGERNFDFYARKQFVKDYDTFYEAGWMGSTKGFTVVHMSKIVEAGELKN